VNGYRLSPQAQADLNEIWDFSAAQWGEPQADAYILFIRRRLEQIGSGTAPVRSARAIERGIMKCPAQSHMIYFRRNGHIDVIRILHQSMDAPKRLTN
jgi:toxin ParE1/3/4